MTTAASTHVPAAPAPPHMGRGSPGGGSPNSLDVAVAAAAAFAATMRSPTAASAVDAPAPTKVSLLAPADVADAVLENKSGALKSANLAGQDPPSPEPHSAQVTGVGPHPQPMVTPPYATARSGSPVSGQGPARQSDATLAPPPVLGDTGPSQFQQVDTQTTAPSGRSSQAPPPSIVSHSEQPAASANKQSSALRDQPNPAAQSQSPPKPAANTTDAAAPSTDTPSRDNMAASQVVAPSQTQYNLGNSHAASDNETTPTDHPATKSAGRVAASGSTESQQSQQSQQSHGTASSVDSTDPTMFAKRDVNPISSQRSQSALSSFSSQASALKKHGKKFHRHDHHNTQHSTRHDGRSHAEHHRGDDRNASKGQGNSAVLGTSCDCACPSPPASPPMHTNDDTRIRTPASAVPSRASSVEIGARMPFSDKHPATEDKLAPADSFLRLNPQTRPTRNYEPAKAVMSTPNSPLRSRQPSLSHLPTAAGEQQAQAAHSNSPQGGSPNNMSSKTVAARMAAAVSAAPELLNGQGLQQGQQQQAHGQPQTHLASRNNSASSGSGSVSPRLASAGNAGDSSAEGHLSARAAGSRTGSNSSTSRSGILPLHRRTSRPDIGMHSEAGSSNDDLSETPAQRGGRVSLRQLREPKQPIYIPAVLRPTEETAYHSTRRITAQSSGRLRTILPPPRTHWQPDSSRDDCTACARKFTLMDRRHHCRKCGELFCSKDSRFIIGVDQNLNFNLFGYPARACRACSDNFTHNVLESSRLSADSTQLSQSLGPQGISIGGQPVEGAPQEMVAGSLVPTAPAEWGWSTF